MLSQYANYHNAKFFTAQFNWLTASHPGAAVITILVG